MHIGGGPLNGVGKPSKHPACFVLGFARSTRYVDLAWEVDDLCPVNRLTNSGSDLHGVQAPSQSLHWRRKAVPDVKVGKSQAPQERKFTEVMTASRQIDSPIQNAWHIVARLHSRNPPSFSTQVDNFYGNGNLNLASVWNHLSPLHSILISITNPTLQQSQFPSMDYLNTSD